MVEKGFVFPDHQKSLLFLGETETQNWDTQSVAQGFAVLTTPPCGIT